MEGFENLRNALEKLEQSSFAQLAEAFDASGGIGNCINGAIQFFVLDRSPEQVFVPMPVVCTIGINYEQKLSEFNGSLRPWFKGRPSVAVENTGCREATAHVLAAYNRNAETWTTRPAYDPSPLEFYASPNATKRSRLLSGESTEIHNRFNLIMTNVSPFITQLKWAQQARSTPSACEQIVRDVSHLDALYETCGTKIDLWIGHSAVSGTKWVWPEFARFVQRHNIRDWILTGNISSQARLWFDRSYRKTNNPRFPWFGPERS